jgi:1-acyl-sn-glycerol-3-phosphate acyltransferase
MSASGSRWLQRLHAYVVAIWAAFSFVFCFFVSIPFMILMRSGGPSIWAARNMWARSLAFIAGVKVEVAGLENIPPTGPVIFACNHESAWDILVIFRVIPRNARFVAKRELFLIPVFGWYLWLAGYIKVDRGNRRRAVASLEKAARKVKAGTSLWVFPEGTRSRDGRIHAFKKGPFVLAIQAGVPIIPMAIVGSRAITPKEEMVLTPGTVKVGVGQPIHPESLGNDRVRLLREVRRRIIELHRGMGGLGGDLDDAVAPAATQDETPSELEASR